MLEIGLALEVNVLIHVSEFVVIKLFVTSIIIYQFVHVLMDTQEILKMLVFALKVRQI